IQLRADLLVVHGPLQSRCRRESTLASWLSPVCAYRSLIRLSRNTWWSIDSAERWWLMVVVASLSGCIAPDVEVIGALGVTVDEEQPGRRGGGVSSVTRSLALNPCR